MSKPKQNKLTRSELLYILYELHSHNISTRQALDAIWGRMQVSEHAKTSNSNAESK